MLTDFEISLLANKHIDYEYLANAFFDLDAGQVHSAGLDDFVVAVIDAHEKKKSHA
jgi:hypothetical protein